jgi:hypothetical protein
MEPNTHFSYGPHEGRHFFSHAGEHLRILGEIPVRKNDPQGHPVLDLDGNPDTSFLAKIPADTPFTFQTLDRRGLVLNMAQTWHQVRPGEMRADCGGCHAHSQRPLEFSSTAAARPDYAVRDLTKGVVDVEFYRDVRPILQRSCVSCHTKSTASPPGRLVLDDLAITNGLPGDYRRLADDREARWGHPPVIENRSWRQTNASRYVRPFQSRRSLLTWKVFGARLDGWTNADHPTESVPGDPSTLPPGTNLSSTDLDYTGTIMPPPGSGVPALTEVEKLTIARWIDLGAPIDTGRQYGQGARGWFLDEIRPVVELSRPRAGVNRGAVDRLRIGLADAVSGVDLATLSVKADFVVAGRAKGAQLADLAVPVGDGIWEIAIGRALPATARARVQVSVKDRQGNVTRVDRRFSVKR